jgi:hypothetical protein
VLREGALGPQVHLEGIERLLPGSPDRLFRLQGWVVRVCVCRVWRWGNRIRRGHVTHYVQRQPRMRNTGTVGLRPLSALLAVLGALAIMGSTVRLRRSRRGRGGPDLRQGEVGDIVSVLILLVGTWCCLAGAAFYALS